MNETTTFEALICDMRRELSDEQGTRPKSLTLTVGSNGWFDVQFFGPDLIGRRVEITVKLLPKGL